VDTADSQLAESTTRGIYDAAVHHGWQTLHLHHGAMIAQAVTDCHLVSLCVQQSCLYLLDLLFILSLRSTYQAYVVNSQPQPQMQPAITMPEGGLTGHPQLGLI
jgi:hypothetical protein